MRMGATQNGKYTFFRVVPYTHGPRFSVYPDFLDSFTRGTLGNQFPA